MIQRCLFRLVLPVVFALLWTPSAEAIDFAHEIVPILRRHCVECHGADQAKGGFSLNTRRLFLEAEAAVPGNAAKSHFLLLIQESDPELQMPPKGKPRVPAEKIALLKEWINAGMPWEPGFSFGKTGWEPPLKPRVVRLPPARDGRNHPIDRILDADLAARGQPPPPPIADARFLRRVTMDAIGLLPSPEERRSFLDESDPAKRTQKIDALLGNDVAYADHWLTTWNDLLRNDYTGTGFITKGRTQITTWLYAALRNNMPYDQFVRELIAPPSADSAGFINGIKWRGEVNASQTLEIQFAQNISQVFLGINMKCASCHDSFIDRWKLEEAYNLAAIFAEKPLELNRCDKPTGVMATPKWLFPEIGQVDPDATKAERLQQLADLMTHKENGRFTRSVVNRIWHRLMGRGIVHPVDAMGTKPWNEDLLDYLAVSFAEGGYDLRQLIRFIMTSQAYQSRSAILESEPGTDYVYAGPIAKRMTAEQFLDSIWQITGTSPAKPDAVVDRVLKKQAANQSLESLRPAEIQAKWIWHKGAVDRKSQLRHTFHLQTAPEAALLIATCDNAFVMTINGMRVAESRDWTQPICCEITDALQLGDNTIEVAAEMFGGAAGFIAQLSVLEEGGDPKTIVSDGNWEARPPKGQWAEAKELHVHGAGPWGSILDPKSLLTPSGPTPAVRASLVKNDFLMRSLGRPHRDQVVTTRPAQLTTLQAIDLANGQILADYLRRGAAQLVGREDPGNWIFEYALSRSPTAVETEVLNDVLGDNPDSVAIEDLLWLVFMQPEFQIIR